MKRMDPMEIVPISNAKEFNEIYNSNIKLVDEVLDKLIIASNRQNSRIFLVSLGFLGLTAVTYTLVNEIVKLKEKVDILTKKNEES